MRVNFKFFFFFLHNNKTMEISGRPLYLFRLANFTACCSVIHHKSVSQQPLWYKCYLLVFGCLRYLCCKISSILAFYEMFMPDICCEINTVGLVFCCPRTHFISSGLCVSHRDCLITLKPLQCALACSFCSELVQSSQIFVVSRMSVCEKNICLFSTPHDKSKFCNLNAEFILG